MVLRFKRAIQTQIYCCDMNHVFICLNYLIHLFIYFCVPFSHHMSNIKYATVLQTCILLFVTYLFQFEDSENLHLLSLVCQSIFLCMI